MTNKTLILKEMGISSWKLKSAESMAPVAELTIPKEKKNMASSYPVWTLVVEDSASFAPLFKNIQKMIQNFGVEVQIVQFDPAIVAKEIHGGLLIAFGERPSQFFSGEHTSVSELREILFETSNRSEQEIPVIATYDLKEVYQNPVKKQQLWTDLIFARNVFLDTMV
jgi:DNA polymerase